MKESRGSEVSFSLIRDDEIGLEREIVGRVVMVVNGSSEGTELQEENSISQRPTVH